MADTKKSPQTSADYTRAIDKIRDEMAGSKGEQIQLLGEGLTAMLQLHPEWEGSILAKGKTLSGALGAVRKNATGGCSDPIQTTKSLCEYYGIECKNPHVLALEVTVAMMGGESDAGASSGTAVAAPPDAAKPLSLRPPVGKAQEPDPFDLDALLGGL